MKNVDITVTTKVAQNRQLVSQFGANLGTQFYKIDNRDIWAGGSEGFEKDKKAVADGTNKGFILNRSPRKFLIKSFEILSTQVCKDPITEEVGIAINSDGQGGCDLFLPLNNDLLRAGGVTADSVAAALRGEKQEFFLNPEKVVDMINRANQQEVENLRIMKNIIDKMEQNLLTAISENKKKADDAKSEWVNSAVKPDMTDVLGGRATGVVITAHED